MINPKIKKYLSGLILLLLFLPLITEAGIGLSVSPQKKEIAVFPGDSYRGQFKLHNPNNINLPVSLEAIPFGAKEGTGEVILGVDETDQSVGRWISFDREDMILSPGEDARLDFQIDIPADAPEGGYYLFVNFQMRTPDFQQRETPRAVPSIGVPIMIATTELALDAREPEEGLMEVTDFSFSSDKRIGFLENLLASGDFGIISSAWASQERTLDFQVIRGQPDQFILEIKNNDLFHLQPRGYLTVTDSAGRELLKTDFVGETILPGRSRRFDLDIEEEWNYRDSDKSLTDFISDAFRGRHRVKLDLYGQSPLRGELSYGESVELPFLTTGPLISLTVVLFVVLILFLMRGRVKMIIKVLTGSKNEKDT